MRVTSRAIAVSIAGGVIVTTVFVYSLVSSGAQTQARPRQLPEYTPSGELILPKNWREWVFVGTPITPIPLNGGKACPEPFSPGDPNCTGFPEYHNVYIEPGSYELFKQSNEFPQGTIIFKELQLMLPAMFPDGSRTEASGRGFFPGAFNGADVTVKDSKRFADTNGWGYFNFNHREPKKQTAKASPKEECAYCHIASAKKDEVWTQFYPLLDR